MNITRELINHFLEAAEDVHFGSHDACRMPVSGARQVWSANLGRLPFESFCVERKQNITHLWNISTYYCMAQQLHKTTHHFVVAATENEHLTFVCNSCVSYNEYLAKENEIEMLNEIESVLFLLGLDYANNFNVESFGIYSPYLWKGTDGYFLSFLVGSSDHRRFCTFSTWTSIGRESL